MISTGLILNKDLVTLERIYRAINLFEGPAKKSASGPTKSSADADSIKQVLNFTETRTSEQEILYKYKQ